MGKRIIEGEEAEGRRITFQPPTPPSMPKLPQMPGMPGGVPKLPQQPGLPGAPQLPQTPGLPGAPQLPQPPQLKPTVGEVWTNTQLHLPVLTKVTGDFGEQTCKCKNQAIPEPSPSMFQIPAGYKDLTAPAPPALPSLPHK